MKCRSGVNKVGWADWTRTVLCRLAGKSGQGQVFLLARHGPHHNFALFIVLNFERGEKLETALLSIYILWSGPIIDSLIGNLNLKCNIASFHTNLETHH